MALYRRVVVLSVSSTTKNPSNLTPKTFPLDGSFLAGVYGTGIVLKILVVLPFPPPSVAVSMAVYHVVRLVAHEYYVKHVVMLLSPVVPKRRREYLLLQKMNGACHWVLSRQLTRDTQGPSSDRTKFQGKKISSCVSDSLSLSLWVGLTG